MIQNVKSVLTDVVDDWVEWVNLINIFVFSNVFFGHTVTYTLITS